MFIHCNDFRGIVTFMGEVTKSAIHFETTSVDVKVAPRERFELPRITPAVFETAAIPGLATSA